MFDIEFNALLKKYSKGEILAYITTERLMWGLKGQQITDTLLIKNNFYKLTLKHKLIL